MKHEGKKPVSVVLVGIGGMGRSYLETLMDEFSPAEVRIPAVVEPYPERSEYRLELQKRGIPILSHLGAFFKTGQAADLVVICSPIHYHVHQTCEALENGSYVLCEKPLGATIQEAQHLIKAKDKAHLWVMIGYQWSFSRVIQALKKDILSGSFGKPLRLKTLCFWSRDEAYYQRNDWAGKISDKGEWVLDSPANNAMAHFLHNLFYVLGERTDSSAMPSEVTAELYRIYPIENYDTVACRAFTDEGVELLYYASHAISENMGPMFSFEFEEATVNYGGSIDEVVARDRKGNEKLYGNPESDHPLRKLFEAVRMIQEPGPILCGPEAARAQTLCMNGMQESVPEIQTFPETMIHRDVEKKSRFGRGLDRGLYDCYKRGILPSEAGFPWACAGKPVKLENYSYFPGGVPPQYEGI